MQAPESAFRLFGKVLSRRRSSKLAITALFLSALCSSSSAQNDGEWISLFNGENLDNWIPKFTGFELGENYRNTFRVEDGYLTVSYDEWPTFNSEFGHLYYDQVFSHYLLRIEYRFIGDQVNDGPGWAFRNNGLMLHSQDPRTMTIDQEFPVSIEAQLLGGNGSADRQTANVCTPGTHAEFGGELVTRHCTNSISGTYHGDQWVTAEFEVRGHQAMVFRANGETVFELEHPQLDPSDPDAQALLAEGAPLMLDKGFITIQAESHPTQFRKIELLPLAP